MKAKFNGGATTVYADYIDAEAGSTLVAEPGGTYDIAPAAGAREGLPVPPDDRWKPARAAQNTGGQH